MNDVECVNGVADVTNTGVSLVRSYNFILLKLLEYFKTIFID